MTLAKWLFLPEPQSCPLWNGVGDIFVMLGPCRSLGRPIMHLVKLVLDAC